ncbi:MAG: phosphodiesterase [Pseudomonadota bacterium]
MRKLLILTDIHVKMPGQEIIGIETSARFKEALSHAIAHQPDAERLIILGDLAHAGKAEEYQTVKEALSDVPIPVHLMLGNHDNRDAFQDTFPHAPKDENGFVQHVIDLGDVAAILMDSLDGPPFRKSHHAGKLCEHRLEWLDAQIATHPDKTIMLCIHHPPFAVGFPGMDAIGLTDGTNFLDRLHNYPNPIHILTGHVHRSVSGIAHGTSYTMLKSIAHQMPLVFDTDDPSISIREPGAYGVILIDGPNIIAHSEDFTLPPMAPITGKDALPD